MRQNTDYLILAFIFAAILNIIIDNKEKSSTKPVEDSIKDLFYFAALLYILKKEQE